MGEFIFFSSFPKILCSWFHMCSHVMHVFYIILDMLCIRVPRGFSRLCKTNNFFLFSMQKELSLKEMIAQGNFDLLWAAYELAERLVTANRIGDLMYACFASFTCEKMVLLDTITENPNVLMDVFNPFVPDDLDMLIDFCLYADAALTRGLDLSSKAKIKYHSHSILFPPLEDMLYHGEPEFMAFCHDKASQFQYPPLDTMKDLFNDTENYDTTSESPTKKPKKLAVDARNNLRIACSKRK